MTTSNKIYQAMAAIMRDIDAIGKDKTNKQQGFQYRGIDDIANALHPLLSKHGVFLTSEILSKSREERTTAKGGALIYTMLRMRYTFHAEDGSAISTEAEGEGMDSGDKSSNKAMSIAQKYALLQTFLIPTEDQAEPDAEGHVVAPKSSTIGSLSKEVRALEQAIADQGLNRERVLRFVKAKWQANVLSDLTSAQCQQLIAGLPKLAARANAPAPRPGSIHPEADKLRDMARALREKAERSDDPQARTDDLADAQEYEQRALEIELKGGVPPILQETIQ